MKLLLLSALAMLAIYVGTVEAAFSALMRLSLRLTVERNGRGKGLGPYLDDPVLLFVPVRLLMGLIVTGAAIVFATMTGVDDFKDPGVLLLSMTGFVVLFEHLIPLLIVRHDPEGVLIALMPSFSLIARALKPLSLSLVGIISTLRRERPVTPAPEGAPAEEENDEAAHAYFDAGEQEGLIERDERRLLESIVDFGDTLVRDVMTPRPDVIAVRAGATLGAIRRVFAEQQYTRVPVFRESLDHIVGFLNIKDFVRLPPDLPATEPVVERLLRPAYFVPETKRVSELLKEFQRQQVQSAVVVDEYGGTAGLVTIEDLLEEIVGEIQDEYDVEEPIVTRLSETEARVDGRADVDELREVFDIELSLEDEDEYDTVGGLIYHRVGGVPSPGDTVAVDGLTLTVETTDGRRVGKVLVVRHPRPDSPHDDEDR